MLGQVRAAASRPVQGLLLALAALGLAAYFPLDHRVGAAHDLSGSLDRRLPVLPLFSLPYLAFLVVVPGAMLVGLCSRRGVARVAVAMVIAFLLSDMVFALYPTIAPRPDHFSGAGSGVLRWLYTHDRPFNDLPSEHVASAVLLGFYAWSGSRAVRFGGVLTVLLVVPSTILIRQHTLAGALGGIVVGVLAWIAAGGMVGRARS